jgi:putative FmdB family regulatory protein
MPTYDYVCDACEHKFEHFQGINDPHLTKCPECKKKKLRRLFGTGGAIMFKGSGFYITDYRSDSYKKGAADDKKSSDSHSSSSSEAKSTESKSSESKSESKTEKSSGPAKSESTSKGSGKSKGGKDKSK